MASGFLPSLSAPSRPRPTVVTPTTEATPAEPAGKTKAQILYEHRRRTGRDMLDQSGVNLTDMPRQAPDARAYIAARYSLPTAGYFRETYPVLFQQWRGLYATSRVL